MEERSSLEDVFYDGCGGGGAKDFHRDLSERKVRAFWERRADNVRYKFENYYL